MITIFYSPTFIRMYTGLEPNLKEEIRDAISLFSDPKNHPKLKVHKLHGVLVGRFSFSVNYKIRIVFRYSDTNPQVANLLHVGPHNEVYG